MEANTYESHDSVQALADVGLTLALSKGRGNANTKKDGLEIARAAARAPSTRRAAPPAEDAHRAYRIRSMGGMPPDGGGQEWAKFGKVPVAAQLMPRMVGDALTAQAEGA